MKNKLSDLHNHLFAQLERLSDESISKEELEKEIKRSKALTSVSNSIVDNARLVLDSQKFIEDVGGKKTPDLLGIRRKDEEYTPAQITFMKTKAGG